MLVIFYLYGPNVSPDNLLPPWLLFACGCSIFWFDQLDIMDGCRARRLKVGSPLGRIIDEAGDLIVMSNYSLMMAYMFCFDNIYLEIVWFYLAMVVAGDEIRFKVTKELVMLVGEISVVEIQLFLCICMWVTSYYGSEVLQLTVQETLEL